ncbi:MAG: hypothetical protein AB7G44_15465 [Bacteroidia bacterium]
MSGQNDYERQNKKKLDARTSQIIFVIIAMALSVLIYWALKQYG